MLDPEQDLEQDLWASKSRQVSELWYVYHTRVQELEWVRPVIV